MIESMYWVRVQYHEYDRNMVRIRPKYGTNTTEIWHKWITLQTIYVGTY